MDIVSILVQAIVKAISYIISAVVFMGKPILVSLYNDYISKYLLSPDYAFPNIVSGSIGTGVKSLYYFIMFEVYDPVLTIVAIVLGVAILINSSLELGYQFKNVLLKLLLLLILSNISFFLLQDILFLFSILYKQLWLYGSPNHTFSSGQDVLAGLEIGGNAGSVISFLIILIYISLMLYLLLFLSLRLAIIYTLPVIAPVFTLLIIIPRTKELGERVWFIFLDAIISPILIGIPLILATYVVNNSVLLLGFLSLADLIPVMLSLGQSQRFLSAFLGRSVDRGVQWSKSAATGGIRGAVSLSSGLPRGSESSGRLPEIGSIRKYSNIDRQEVGSSSLFFKVKRE
ncbi:MAG: hypothetical protein QXQ72_00735 [Thermoplasmatales archaeon]